MATLERSPSAASADTAPPPAALASGKTSCPPHVLAAIYGAAGAPGPEKQKAYDKSLHRWWSDYADRKNDDEADEHVADSLLYDRRHLPRTAPAPECVARLKREEEEEKEKAAATAAGSSAAAAPAAVAAAPAADAAAAAAAAEEASSRPQQ